MWGTVFVASPSATARAPVAAGSSVPAWPAFCALKAHFTLFTTEVEVMPAGLSMTSQPEMARPFFVRAMPTPLTAMGSASQGTLFRQPVRASPLGFQILWNACYPFAHEMDIAEHPDRHPIVRRTGRGGDVPVFPSSAGRLVRAD